VDEPLLTEREAARVLRVSARTLRRYRTERKGHGPPVAGYVGRSPRYRRSDLDRWLEQTRDR
jgi:predicted site-specific integrase-resolvase